MKYAFDTNLYIRAIRDHAFGKQVAEFCARHSPRLHLCSVVLHELLVGADSPAQARKIRDDIARPIEKKDRIVTPSHEAWDRAGDALSALAVKHGIERSEMPCALVNDALIAASCAEAGITLLTDNLRDFERIGLYVPIRFAEPWPPNQ